MISTKDNINIYRIIVGIYSFILLFYFIISLIPFYINSFKILIFFSAILILFFFINLYNIKIDFIYDIKNLIIIFLAFVYLIISFSFSKDIKLFLKTYVTIFISFLYCQLCIQKFGKIFIYTFLKQLCIFLNIAAVLNLYQIFFHVPYIYNINIIKHVGMLGTNNYRPCSVFSHPIIWAFFIVVCLVMNRIFIKKKYYYFLQVFLLINLYFTKSRSIWIAFVLTIVIYILVNGKNLLVSFFHKKRPAFLYIYFAFLAAALLIYMVKFGSTLIFDIASRFGDSLSLSSTDVSNLQRVGTLNYGINYLLNLNNYKILLFGNGMGFSKIFMMEHPVIIKDFTTTDNMYLTIILDFGILMFALVCIFFILNLKRIIKKDSNNDVYLSSCYLVFVNMISIFFFENIGWTSIDVFLGVLLSILVLKKDYFDQEVQGG